MPEISPMELIAYVESILVAAGAPEHDSAIVAAHLVESNLKGHDSHGVVRLPVYVSGVQRGFTKPGTPITIDRETDSTAVVNCGWNFGQVAARRCMQLAIEKARVGGVGVVTGYRMTHVGRLGAYVEQATEAGMVGFAAASYAEGGRIVAPYGGAARRLSTNPIAVGVPTADRDAPFIFDTATSGAAEGKLRMARNLGQPIAEGLLLTTEGAPTTDPNDFYSGGALLPLAGHKGFGLALSLQALGTLLAPNPAQPGTASQGLFIMVLDPEKFAGRVALEASMSALIEEVKQPPYQAGFDEILVPGEGSRRRAGERAFAIPLDDETWRQLTEVATLLGVETPSLEPREPRRRRSADSEAASFDD